MPALPLHPPSVQPLDQGDEDSDTETGGGGGGGEEDKKELQDEILIPQPKGIGSLELKQLGVKLNWSDNTYEHIVKHAEKVFPKYLQNNICWKTQAVKISLQKRAQEHGKHLNTRQCLCKKKVEKVHTKVVKRTATAVQEAVAP
ncbi:hypothetical protein EDD18DRAFT_1104256 [Armillaria luteobubalina]|uniref:Uncharacterized protein n=1 Tax=Armillaria luteobubalina TaxID=153913 RepID=A0AA39UQ26_9AGAR|nr:hypothetical protein EDD18DRAFT_1104256 [Armillaria luteobubalina]